MRIRAPTVKAKTVSLFLMNINSHILMKTTLANPKRKTRRRKKNRRKKRIKRKKAKETAMKVYWQMISN